MFGFNTSYLLKSFAVVLIAFFTPIKWLIVGVMALIFFDTITGVYKAYKTGEKVTSRRFSNIISKFVLYNIAIIAGYILQLMVGVDWIPLAKLISVSISLTELKSIAENINIVTGIDLWKFILSYLKRNTDQFSQSVNEGLNEKDIQK